MKNTIIQYNKLRKTEILLHHKTRKNDKIRKQIENIRKDIGTLLTTIPEETTVYRTISVGVFYKPFLKTFDYKKYTFVIVGNIMWVGKINEKNEVELCHTKRDYQR